MLNISTQNPIIFEMPWPVFISQLSVLVANLYLNAKRNIPFNQAYDALTQKPISGTIIRVFKKGSKKLIHTTVSTADGLFKLANLHGKFRLRASNPEYNYPSQLVKSKYDPPYTNTYQGGDVYLQPDRSSSVHIPLDPKFSPLNLKSIQRRLQYYYQSALYPIRIILLILGILLSAFIWIFWPNFANLLFSILYLHVIYVFISNYYRYSKHHGLVLNFKNEAPIKNLELGLFEPEFNRLIAKTYTDSKGRYLLAVPSNNYLLRILNPDYKIVHNNQLVQEILIKKKIFKQRFQYVNLTLEVEDIVKNNHCYPSETKSEEESNPT